MSIFSKDEYEKLKGGDHDVFNRYYSAYKEVVYNYLLIKTSGDEDRAGELFCEVNCAVYRSIKNLKKNDNLLGWVIKIAHRKYCNYIRKAVKEQKLIKNLINDLMVKIKERESIPHNETKITIFTTACENMKEKYKNIIDLKYVKGKSIKELAQILEISESAVGGLLFRAKENLKKEVQKLIKYFNEE
ncbi:MAG: sigma-70 family RNA polymerase sigma factor [Spirochaetales bacterium]|nr:sigma-70 family RNA polymerase sigma factor [Spirochaetales bacterium]